MGQGRSWRPPPTPGTGHVVGSGVRDLRDQRAVDVGQPHVAAVEPVGQLRVIHAQQMQHRRVQVVVRDRLFLRLVAELVGRSDRSARP